MAHPVRSRMTSAIVDHHSGPWSVTAYSNRAVRAARPGGRDDAVKGPAPVAHADQRTTPRDRGRSRRKSSSGRALPMEQAASTVVDTQTVSVVLHSGTDTIAIGSANSPAVGDHLGVQART